MNTQTQLKLHVPLADRVRAFTLVELLLVIAIIGVLTTMSLNLLAGAANDAKISATQSRISQITALLKLHVEDYEVRRLPLSMREINDYVVNNKGGDPLSNPLLYRRDLRRHLLLDMINAEMPRPVRNNIAVGTGIPDTDDSIQYLLNGELGSFPSVCNCGDRQSFRVWLEEDYQESAGVFDIPLAERLAQVPSASVSRWRRFATDTDFNHPAEYLYEILNTVQIDGISAIESLGNAAIGDDDEDGFPEIVDAWGEPMHFDIEQVVYELGSDGLYVANPLLGYVPLDPRFPARLDDLRFVVGSARIPESLPLVEQAQLGLVQ